VSFNPGAPNLDDEMRRFEFKVEAGAEFVVTRPVFDVAAFRAVLRRLAGSGLPIVAGIMPFDSARNAEFVANEVPGVRVPEALIDRMRRASGPQGAADEGVTIAQEIATELRDSVNGVQISTPSGSVRAALAVIDGLR
jgi:homocysteine S-methyltransferase